MDNEARRNKIDVVWAALVLLVLSFAGLALLFSVPYETRLMTSIAATLIGAAIASLFNVTFLLSNPSCGPATQGGGRILLWLAFAALAAAGGMAIYAVID